MTLLGLMLIYKNEQFIVCVFGVIIFTNTPEQELI